MSDFYTYRNEFSRKRRQRRIVGVLSVLFALACLGAAWYWYQSREPEQTPAPTPTPAAAEPTQSPETAATPAPTPATGETPERIVQAVDTAVWNTSTPVEQTIDTEDFNTDHRMVGVPLLGTVTPSYSHAATFVGDSSASGLGLYATGLPNAKYATYISAGVNSFVNNATMTNAVTHVEETPMEAIAATQPD